MTRCTLALALGVASLLVTLGKELAHAEEGVSSPQTIAPSLQDVQANDLSRKFSIDEGDPENSVPTPEQAMKNPLEMGYLMMDMIARAEAASQRGDHAAAARYYRAVAKAVPERATSFSKLCTAYRELGDLQSAVDACREALGKGGVTVDDHVQFVRTSLRLAGPLSAARVEELEAIIAHLSEQLGADHAGRVLAALLRCELATRLEDMERLQACTEDLTALAPADRRTIAFQYALALEQQDYQRAEQIVQAAEAAGVPARAVDEMVAHLEAARARRPKWERMFLDWRSLSALVLLLAFAYGVVRYVGRSDGLRPA
jgi:hypothetical protein